MEWEAWLEKGRLRNLITSPDIYSNEIAHVDGTYTREPPVSDEDIKTHHAEKEKPRMFPTITREFVDDAEDKESKKSWEDWLEKDAMDGKQSGSPKDEEPKRDYLKEFHDEIKRIKEAGKNDPKRLAYLKDQKKNKKRIQQHLDSNNLINNYSKRLRTNSKKLRSGEEQLDDLGDETNVELGNVKDFAMGNEGYYKKSWEVWLEKDSIKPSKGQLKDGNKPKGYNYEKAPHVEIGDKNSDSYEMVKTPDNEFQSQSTRERSRELSDESLYNDDMEKLVSAQNIGVLTSPSDRDNKIRQGIAPHIAHAEKSWEAWLDKNNAIETSHKEDEKKHEWDGKFSSSTIRDDVKDDDDKAVSEEESLEELTDGKLEEIEKLKSWESWLEKDALTNRWIETIPKKSVTNSMEDSQSFSRQSTGARYEQDPRGKRSASSIKWGKLGDVGELNYKKILNDKGEETEKYVKNSNVGGGKKNALAHGNKKRQQNAATKKPTPPTGEAPTGVRKTWESWLEKNDKWDKEEKKHDKKHIKHGKSKKDTIADMKALHRHMSEERQRDDDIETNEIIGDVKNPILYETQDKPRPTPSIMPKNLTHKKPRYVKGVEQKGDVADERDSLNIQIADSMKSWKSWLDKMQGAGDARFGNQHLTGLDQKPVNNEEDEANILPEKEEKTDDKEEKQEKTDNKPYKALGGE